MCNLSCFQNHCRQYLELWTWKQCVQLNVKVVKLFAQFLGKMSLISGTVMSMDIDSILIKIVLFFSWDYAIFKMVKHVFLRWVVLQIWLWKKFTNWTISQEQLNVEKRALPFWNPVRKWETLIKIRWKMKKIHFKETQSTFLCNTLYIKHF